MDGALRLALSSGARFIEGSSLDLNFQQGQYRANNARKTLAEIDTYHTRSSAAFAELLNGDYVEYATNIARIISGLGYQHEGAATNVIDPDLSNWYMSNGLIPTYGIADPWGGNRAVRLTCDGSTDPYASLYPTLDSSEKTYTYQGWIRISNNPSSHTGVSVLYKYLPSVADVEREDIPMSEDWSYFEWTFTNAVNANGLANTFRIDPFGSYGSSHGAGTNAPANGASVDVFFFDIKEDTFASSPADGARSADGMDIPTTLTDSGECTIGASFIYEGGESFHWPFAVNDGTSTEEIGFYIRDGGAGMKLKVSSGGSDMSIDVIPSSTIINSGDRVVLAWSVSASEIVGSVSINGAIPLTGTLITDIGCPSATQLSVGSSSNDKRVNGIYTRVVAFDSIQDTAALVEELL